MSSYVQHWAIAFVFTQLVEVPVYMRFFGCGPLRAFGASVLTHPAIWCVFPLLHMRYVLAVALSELFAWWVEAAYFTPTYGARRSLRIALFANFASASLGALSRYVLGAP